MYESNHVIILTALPVEYLAVRAHLTSLTEKVHPRGTIYEQGQFNSPQGGWNVSIVEIGAGNSGAAAEAERAIEFLDPCLAFFVGVAGGIKDVSLGDVVIATKVYGYESGKSADEFLPRPELGNSAYPLQQRAKAIARNAEWQQRIQSMGVTIPKAFVRPIVAGNKVISSKKSEVYRFLRLQYGDALAVEMEGFGFLRALEANRQVEAIVIRGISDLLTSKSASDAKGWQEIASRHASAFTFQILSELQFGTDQKSSPLSASRKAIDYNFSSEARQPSTKSSATYVESGGGDIALDNSKIVKSDRGTIITGGQVTIHNDLNIKNG